MANTPFGWRRPPPAKPIDIPQLIADWENAITLLITAQAEAQSIPRVIDENDPDKPAWYPLDEDTDRKLTFIEECELAPVTGWMPGEAMAPASDFAFAGLSEAWDTYENDMLRKRNLPAALISSLKSKFFLGAWTVIGLWRAGQNLEAVLCEIEDYYAIGERGDEVVTGNGQSPPNH